MLFAHDTEASLAAAVALVNSPLDPETLTSPAELEEFFRAHGYTGRFDGDTAELARVHAIRPRLRELLTADRAAGAELVNRILVEQDATPQLVRHEGHDWHLHAVETDRPLDERIAVETALAMIDLIRADELGRLRVCAAEGCEGIVADFTRNRTKRFCSTRCANRSAVAAYRERKRAKTGG